MSRIDDASQLAALVRAQIANRLRGESPSAKVARHSPDTGRQPTEAHSRHSPTTAPEATSQALVALRVRALSADDPQRRRKAFRIFLESVLVQELGRESAGDPGFDQLVDQVMAQMESEPVTQAALLRAGDLLLAGTVPPAH